MPAIDRLETIQKKFFAITGALYENVELLGTELYKLMLRDVIEVYKNESDVFRKEEKINYDCKRYKIASDKKLRKPGHVFLFFGTNEPGKLIRREEKAVYQKEYNARVDEVEKREAELEREAAEKIERQATIDNDDLIPGSEPELEPELEPEKNS